MRAEAHELAVRLAELTLPGGCRARLSGVTRRRLRWPPMPPTPHEALHFGAAVAWGRYAGNEAIRLYRAAAEAARRAGDPRRAARELAAAAELIIHAPGIMSEPTPPGEEQALLAEARALAVGDAYVEAAVLKVTAYLGGDDATRRRSSSPNAPSSWPGGSATPAWRAPPSTS